MRKIAAQDKRDDGGQVRWLVTAYAEGELVSRVKYDRLMDAFERHLEGMNKKLDHMAEQDELVDQQILLLQQRLRGGKKTSGSLRGGKGPLPASKRASELYEASQQSLPGRQNKHPRRQQ